MATLRHRLGAFLSVLCGASVASAQTVPSYGSPPLHSSGTGIVGSSPLQMAGPGTIPQPPLGASTNVGGNAALAGSGPSSTNTLCGGSGCIQQICCGPVGANGPITYELQFRTGPDWVIGGSSEFSAAVGFGWGVSGVGRTLFFNPAQDAAWVFDLGVFYTYNDGDSTRILDVFTPAPVNQQTGQPTRPDELHPFFVRGLNRSGFSFGLGRDWFLNGPGTVGSPCPWNSRFGVDVGGKWGYAHADLIPVEDPNNYLRRSGVHHGLYLGSTWTWERPMGAWILFGGARAQWDYTWMNIAPPVDTNLSNVSLQGFVGFRF